jgi:hypothetical protein
LQSQNPPQKKRLPFFGNPAVYMRPVAFRPCLATGLALAYPADPRAGEVNVDRIQSVASLIPDDHWPYYSINSDVFILNN